MKIESVQGEFRFRQFVVRHDRCGMKVGTDGILLGAWAEVDGARKILDVGTGSGLIALMLAQRNLGARIDAIEIDPVASGQAAENMAASPWADRVSVTNQSLQDFVSTSRENSLRFDRVVCNPPFFHGQITAAESARQVARHGTELSMDELVAGVAELLEPTGRFCLIFPDDLSDRFRQLAAGAGLEMFRQTVVHPRPDVLAKRRLLEFGFGTVAEPVFESLTVEDSKHVYSDDWQELTGEFYV